jgi:hypothetical protein
MTYGTMPLKSTALFARKGTRKMHRSFVLTVVLVTSLAGMQAPATQTASAVSPTNTSATKNVPGSATNQGARSGGTSLEASDPVITIHGLCSPTNAGRKTSARCTTIVTRQEFDTVVNGLNAIGPQLLPLQRRAVAEGYATTLVSYEAAKKAGVERDPRFAEVMRLARMRAMGDMYKALMQEKARKVSAQEIETYYKSNPEKFEELTMRRITLPRYNPANLKDEGFAAKARKIAEQIHTRAAKGEDLDKLEKDAFDALGMNRPPTTNMGPVRRGVFSPEQEKQLFALKPGEVTNIVEQPSAFIIFKLENRRTLSLDQAKDEIMRTVVKQHMEKQEQARDHAIRIDYNEQYVGPPQNSAWMPASQLNQQTEAHAAGDPKTDSTKPESPK